MSNHNEITVYPLIFNDDVWMKDKGYNIEQVFTDYEKIKPGPKSLAIFHGSRADIDPIYYGETPHPKTNKADVKRDKWESEALDYCINNGVNILGICRGAQWACIKAGGKLIQHIDGHNNENHELIYSFKAYKGPHFINSYHHQAINLHNTTNIVNFAQSYDGIPEIILFKDIKALAIQGHPEWMPSDNYMNTTYIPLLLDKFLGI